MAEKKKVIRITTPAGIAKYPWIQKADTRFKDLGEYSIQLVLSNALAAPIIEQLAPLSGEAFEAGKVKCGEKLAGPAKAKAVAAMQHHEFFKAEADAEGNETGNTIFKFKMNAQAEINGETKFFKPSVFDAKGQPVTKNINVYGGSTVKVNFSPSPFYNAATKTAGISLRLNAVQVIKLVTGGYDAASCGFGVEEDGFEFADGTAAGPAAAADGAETPASDF